MPCQTILSLAWRPRSGDVNRACPVSERTLSRLPKPADLNDDATGQPVARMQSLNHEKHIQCFHSFQNASLTTLSKITHTVCFCNDSRPLLTETVSGVDKPALSHFVLAAPRVDRADNETAPLARNICLLPSRGSVAASDYFEAAPGARDVSGGLSGSVRPLNVDAQIPFSVCSPAEEVTIQSAFDW